MSNEFKTPDERPDDIIIRDQEANQALYDEYGAHYKSRENAVYKEEDSKQSIGIIKEYKPEILSITEVGEKANIEIDKCINDPKLIRALCGNGEGLKTRDIQLQFIRRLIVKISGNEKVMKLNDEKLTRTYKNIDFHKLWKAIFNYRNKQRAGKHKIEDKSKELDRTDSQLERYRNLTKKEIFKKLRFFHRGLSTHDKVEREQIMESIALLNKVLLEKK